jgi:hypothetical protein
MTNTLKWKLAAATVAVVAAAGGSVGISSAARGPATATAVSPAAPPPGDGRPGFGHGGDPLSSASTYLGVSASQLLTQLQAGKTLAQIANATSGKSAAGLIAAMVAAEKQQIEQAVSDGRLTRSQADAIEADLQQRVTDRVNGTFGGPGDHPRCGPPGADASGSRQLRTGRV